MTNKSIYCSIIISLLLFVSCSEDEPTQANNYIDPKLFGEWYLIDTLTTTIPTPEYSFRGFQINHNNQMISLGIETNTGKVAYMEYPTIDSIIYAYNGRMLLKRFWWGGYSGDTVDYIVDNYKLILKMYGITYIYYKTSLSSQLFNPKMSDLSVDIDSVAMTNFKVFYHPSAYLSQKNSDSITLFVHLKQAMIQIDIDNFSGTGQYIIPLKKANLMIVDGDVVYTFPSDSASTNTFSIDQFDDINNVCSGRFSFDVGDMGYNIQLRDGTFIVPIYK